MSNYPVTIIVTALALLAHAIEAIAQWLQLDFALAVDGQWWRFWTGHVTHYDGNHLLWDSLMFVVLGAACESKHPKQFAAAIFLMMAGISAAVGLLCSEITIYRGLSGLATGLFVWFAADQIRQSVRQHDRLAATLWLLPCLGLMSKLFFEAATGETLFVDSSHFQPLVESHLAGAVIGVLLSLSATASRTTMPVRAKALFHSAKSLVKAVRTAREITE